MDEEYDVVLLGTGLTECVLSGLLAMDGRRVLVVDHRPYYGGECASLSMSRLHERAGREAYDGRSMGRDRDWNVDVVPKLMMADGALVEMLVHTDVTRYLEFQQIAGSFVFRRGTGVAKVPSTEMEALASSLIGLFEKRRAYNFFEYVRAVDPTDPGTWRERNLIRMTAAELFALFSLEEGTQDFVGHALALHGDESYQSRSALETIERIRLYMASMLRFGRSPYVYPLYGLGELPQAFARLAAIYGGTFMLDTPVSVLYEDGRAVGVTSNGQTARAKKVVCAPEYAPLDAIAPQGIVVRAVCVLDHAVPSTSGADSCQIIVPQRQIASGKKYDVYVAVLSSAHRVCPAPYTVALVSVVTERTDIRVSANGPLDAASLAAAEAEIAPGVSLLGPVLKKFVWASRIYAPNASALPENLHVSRSYDASSHFDSVVDDIRRLYREVTGLDLVLRQRPPPEAEAAPRS